MYESEANRKAETLPLLPPDAIAGLAELRNNVVARTVLPWSEHCTECVWPTCYSSCDLYSPREDGKCRRFIDGMVRVECAEALNYYLLKIRFKRWAKLWAPGNLRLHVLESARRIERRDYVIGSALHSIPLPPHLKGLITGKRYSFKNRMARRSGSDHVQATCFILECYNPESFLIRLSLTIRSFKEHEHLPFQTLIELKPGFQRVRLPLADIAEIVDLHSPFSIELIPNDVADGTTLYFGTMDFISELNPPKSDIGANNSQAKIKCVVWDLDNTLWDGILVEDGPEKLKLKPGISEVIRELDRRGILHSIASKNNREEALKVLKHFELDDYFLCPQISWSPKSGAIRAIAQDLNIGVDTLLYVDDSQFELEQVKAIHPQVRTLHAENYLMIPQMPECPDSITGESQSRRRMYQTEASRQSVAAGFGQDYMAFLKHCNIQLVVKALSEENLERVHELTQRTNQMNFSGNRYDRAVLRQILDSPDLDTYVLDCKDRFGSYGVIGFSIIDRHEPRMTDLMFSCRIQSKRVEHSFLAYVIRKYVAETGRDFRANYRKTPRNEPSGKVFADLGFEEEGAHDGVSFLLFRKERSLLDEAVLQIVTEQDSAPPIAV